LQNEPKSPVAFALALALGLGSLLLTGCQVRKPEDSQGQVPVPDQVPAKLNRAAHDTADTSSEQKKDAVGQDRAVGTAGGADETADKISDKVSDKGSDQTSNTATGKSGSKVDIGLHIIPISEEKAKRIDLKTEVVKERDLTLTLYLTGHIEPDTGCDVDVSARIAGRITKILIKPGEKVEKGQLLAMIDSREVAELEGEMLEAKSKLDIAQAHAERERQVYEEQIARPKALLDARARAAHAKVKLDLAQSEFHRVEDLYKEKIAAGKDFVAAKAALAEAKLEMDQDQTALLREQHLYDNRVLMKKDYQLAMAEVTREKQHLSTIIKRLEFIGADRKLTENVLKTGDMNGLARIVAPIDGIVNHYEFAAGEMIHPEDSIFKLTNLHNVQVYADLPEVDLQRVKLGDHVKIKVTSYPHDSFEGTISLIAQHVQLQTHSLSIHARLANPAGKLKPNMHVEMDLDSTFGRCLACPATAVRRYEGRKIVFVKRPGGFEERTVKLGASTVDYVEVIEGLQAGEEVATHGSHLLENMR
jgi:multidrug efflux pump subunit AcrA (membrane-fusion protein)